MNILIACEESQRVVLNLENQDTKHIRATLSLAVVGIQNGTYKMMCYHCLTEIVTLKQLMEICTKKDGRKTTFSSDFGYIGKETGKKRSKTYAGVAKAMAEQWERSKL